MTSTDAYDTIDWLVKNVPESNGRVGIIGISYDGYEPLVALVNPHPALKVSVPMNPMVDGWRGDDWFHNGAYRQTGTDYIFEQEATRDNSAKVRVELIRPLRRLHAGYLGWRIRAPARVGAGRILARDHSAPRLRQLLAEPGDGQDLGLAATQGSGDAGRQSMGRRGHLRRACGLPGDRAQGYEQ